MSKDRNERRHRRTVRHPESVAAIVNMNTDTFSLAAAMGLRRCIHGESFPCLQCQANRRWNQAATGRLLTDAEFEAEYALPDKDNH